MDCLPLGGTEPGLNSSMILTLMLACLTSVIGSQFANWWQGTKIGDWFNQLLDQWLSWTTHKLHMKAFAKTENLKDKFHDVETRLTALQLRVDDLTKSQKDR